MRGGVDQSRLGIEGEIVLDALREADRGVERGAVGMQILRAPVGNVAVERDQRRGEEIGGGARRRGITADARRGGDLAQRRRSVRRHRHRPVDLDPRYALDHQMAHRLFDHHPHHIGEPRLGARGRDAARGRDRQAIIEQILARPVDRFEPQIAARELDARAVVEACDVADVVDHRSFPSCRT